MRTPLFLAKCISGHFRGTMQASPQKMVHVLRALGQVTRLEAAGLLRHEEMSVMDLAEGLAKSQSVISRHMRIMAQASVVVRSPRDGRVFYRLTQDETVRRIIDLSAGE